MRRRVTHGFLAVALGCVMAGALAALPTAPADAQERWHHQFHGRDVHGFDRHELGLWRGGGWHHEMHNGRLGWWWVAGGAWYFYDRPVYPYPLVVSDVAFADPVVVAAPPTVVVVPGAPAAAPPPAAQPQMWYYCDNPAGYYPYVASCNTPFRPVPARPQ